MGDAAAETAAERAGKFALVFGVGVRIDWEIVDVGVGCGAGWSVRLKNSLGWAKKGASDWWWGGDGRRGGGFGNGVDGRVGVADDER